MKINPISKYAGGETKLRLKRFTKDLRHAAKHSEDPEAIHDLRVSIRRVAQALRTFRDLLDPYSVEKLRRRLHQVMDLCAAVRNCDIALTLLDQAGIKGSASALRLQNTRSAAVKKLYRRLKKERQKRRAAPDLRSHPKEEDWKPNQSLEANLCRVLPTLVEEFFASGRAAISTHASDQTLHQFRLRAKRFRYTLELFERFYGSEMERGSEILKHLQDRLGAINDCATTIEMLGADRGAAAAVGKLLRKRRAALHAYALGRFAAKELDWWKRWLALPRKSAA
ncbi:MAG: CHAD domain-containing protein [Acidobacteriota bacterium]